MAKIINEGGGNGGIILRGDLGRKVIVKEPIVNVKTCKKCGAVMETGNFCGVCGAEQGKKESKVHGLNPGDMWECVLCAEMNEASSTVCSLCGQQRKD